MPNQTTVSPKKRLLAAAAIFCLPVLVIIVAVSALLSHHKTSAKTGTNSAFNTNLPSPNLPKGEKNKLEIYMQAQQDSIKQRQERAKDPYVGATTDPTASGLPKPPVAIMPAFHSSGGDGNPVYSPESNDRKVAERLQKIYAALGSSTAGTAGDRSFSPGSAPSQPPAASAELPRLERLIASLHQTDTATDPRLRQIKDVLDQVMALKYPDRMAAGNNTPTERVVLPVEATPPPTDDSLYPAPIRSTANGFFGLNDEADSAATATTLQAVVHATQIVQTGSIVKLRLLQPIYVGGRPIPANAFIYGPATINGERVTIQLTNAIYNGRIYPIALKVYDGADGLEGLFVPGMITRDVVKQNMSQGVSGLNIGTLDPSLGAQAAAAGIETARNLLSRKISLVKATLKAGHLAILKGANNQ
ncbi:MAG TPA: conjugative transposon protein TraM [Puia sp.]|uniref:conjugative transposon protein TraM n=1 Tax=Puia sp. TaxID=2045100 RepID=UPI002BE08E5B|nr:conjugative transposon protein TraM [Puia sp.]HVU97742.1 conjugative transposon protein TraM [Puia sp.]